MTAKKRKKFLREGRRTHKTPQRRKLPIGIVYHVNYKVGGGSPRLHPFTFYFCLSFSFPSLFLLLVTTKKRVRHRVSLMVNDSVAFVIL